MPWLAIFTARVFKRKLKNRVSVALAPKIKGEFSIDRKLTFSNPPWFALVVLCEG
jgi:hypothetical protein